MHLNKGSKSLHIFAHGLPRGGIGGDGGADGDAAIFGDFRGHIADPANVQVAVFFGKSQFRG